MKLIEVNWPSATPSEDHRQEALKQARRVAHNFENTHAPIRDASREHSVPKYDGDEIVMSAHIIRYSPAYTVDYELRTVRIIMDLHKGSFGGQSEHVRGRFADRSIDGHYAIRFLQKEVLNTDHAQMAAQDMALEARILMNLQPHPNILQCYGSNSDGLASLLARGRKSFFIITDRIAESLSDRMDRWRYRREVPSLATRMELTADIVSALLHLHSREMVYYLRPEKVGFDTRHDRIKLTDFGQVTREGQAPLPASLTLSDHPRTNAYTAPEVLSQAAATATTASDVYAFGMLVWELLSLERPRLQRAQHYQKVVVEHQRPRIPVKKWPPPVCDLISHCWDPHLRPTMQTVNETLQSILLYSDETFDKQQRESKERRPASTPRYSSDGGAEISRTDRSRRPSTHQRRKSVDPAAMASRRSSHSKATPPDLMSPDGRKIVRGKVSRKNSGSMGTPDSSSSKTKRRIRVGSVDSQEEVPVVLAKLGLRLDEDESGATTQTTPSSLQSWSSSTISGEDEENVGTSARGRNKSKHGETSSSEAPVGKTHGRRRSSIDESAGSSSDNHHQVPKTPKSRAPKTSMVAHTPVARRRSSGMSSAKSSPSSSSSSSPLRRKSLTRRKSARRPPQRTSSKTGKSAEDLRPQLHRSASAESVFSTVDSSPPVCPPTPAENLQRMGSMRNMNGLSSEDLLAELVGNLCSPVPPGAHRRSATLTSNPMPIVPAGIHHHPSTPEKEPPRRRFLRRGSA